MEKLNIEFTSLDMPFDKVKDSSIGTLILGFENNTLALRTTDILHRRKFDKAHNLVALIAEDYDLIKNFEFNKTLTSPALDTEAYLKDPHNYMVVLNNSSNEMSAALNTINPVEKNVSNLVSFGQDKSVLDFKFSVNGLFIVLKRVNSLEFLYGNEFTSSIIITTDSIKDYMVSPCER